MYRHHSPSMWSKTFNFGAPDRYHSSLSRIYHKESSRLRSKNILLFVFCALLTLCLFFVATTPNASAQTYKLLAPLPQGEATVDVETGFSTYAANLFWFLLSAAVILALVMMIIGGVEYVGSAGNTSLVGDAKGRMLNALLGLLLALSAWLILNLINPDLVDFKITIPEIPGIISGTNTNARFAVCNDGTQSIATNCTNTCQSHGGVKSCTGGPGSLPSTPTPPLTPGTTKPPPTSPGSTPTPPSTTVPPGNPNNPNANAPQELEIPPPPPNI